MEKTAQKGKNTKLLGNTRRIWKFVTNRGKIVNHDFKDERYCAICCRAENTGNLKVINEFFLSVKIYLNLAP